MFLAKKKQRGRAVHRGWESQDTLGGCWWWGYEVAGTPPAYALPSIFAWGWEGQANWYIQNWPRENGLAARIPGPQFWFS